MNTFIFLWNPKDWKWAPSETSPHQKTLAEAMAEISDTGITFENWNCKHHNKVRIGDRAMLAITGNGPRGFFGSGIVCSGKFSESDERNSANMVNKVRLQLDVLINPYAPDVSPILTNAVLKEILKEYKTPRSSGESINEQVGKQLYFVWDEFINQLRTGGHDDNNTLTEGHKREARQTIYERNKDARQKCIDYYGVKCVICEFDFEKTYGHVAKDFIHVHHLTNFPSYGGIHAINPIEGLRPVCPNCHSLIHKKRNPYTIEEVAEFIRRAKAN